MKFLGKTFIFIALMAGAHLQAFDDLAPEEIQRNIQKEKDKKLLQAINKPDVDTVKLLLHSGADANCDLSAEESHLSVRPLPTVALCMEGVLKQQERYQRDLDQMSQNLFDPALTHQVQRVSMSRYSAKSCVDIARLLLEAKADPNKHARGMYVMSTGTWHEVGNRPLDVCQELVISSTKYDLTPVHAMIFLLIDHGADVSSVPKLQKLMSKKINEEVADALPRFSLDLTRIVSGYII